MPNDISKLPKWAQDQYRTLHAENEDLRARIALLEGEGKYEGTEVFITGHGVEGDIPLPAGSHIVFRTGPHSSDYIQVGMNRTRDPSGLLNHPKALQVRTGGGAAVVIPSARNVVHVDQSYDY